MASTSGHHLRDPHINMASYQMNCNTTIAPHIFKAMEMMNSDVLMKSPEEKVRPILPCLARLGLYPSLDSSKEGKDKRKKVLAILSKFDAVNSFIDMLSIDFQTLEQDVKKEHQLRSKMGGTSSDSVLVSQFSHGSALEFERSQNNPEHRIRLLLSEILLIMSEVKDDKLGSLHKQSDLFESMVYKDDIIDALCIAIAELPQLLNVCDVSEALLCVDNGPDFVCQIVANFPDSFLPVCQHIIMKGEKFGEDSYAGRCRFELLIKLCAMNPSSALDIRSLCVEYSSMPGLAVAISLQSNRHDITQVNTDSVPMETDCEIVGNWSTYDSLQKYLCSDDVVPFLSGILLGSDVAARNWISSYIKTAQKHKPEWPSLVRLRQHLLDLVNRLTPNQGQSLPKGQVVQACAILRLYSALKAIASLKLSEEELSFLLRLVISQPCVSPVGAHFLSVAICFIMACPGIIRGMDEEQQTIAWLKLIMSCDDHFNKYSNDSSSPREMLFLLALHFHNNQMQAVTELVCNTLGMKCTVKASALVKIRQIFTMELFTEQVIANHAIKIPVTQDLDSKSTGYLPVHSILQLLKSRAFAKHRVCVKNWVVEQIKESRFPLHPLLPQLIESYVHTVIPKSLKPEHTNEPLDADEICALFQHDIATAQSLNACSNRDLEKRVRCPQLLILYYLLLYEDQYQTHKKMIDIRKLQPYSEGVISEIPISLLVQEALDHNNNCQNLFPPMIRLLSTHFPHLCLVEDWLDMNSGLLHADKQSASSGFHQTISHYSHHYISTTQFSQDLTDLIDHPGAAIRSLERVLCLNDLSTLQSCQEVLVASIPKMLLPDLPQRLQDLLKKAWFRLHAIIPRRLRVSTVNALHSSGSGVMKTSTLSEQDLVMDPLVVLRCDDRVFRCPPVLEILLRILAAYSQACRVYLNAHASDMTGLADKEKDRHELKTALLATQESAIVQILLEICAESDTENASKLSHLRQVRCLVFSYIHQVFIADPNLAKLVHFQGYPSHLISLVVSGVPSMHICLDFIPELLGQPQRNKQIFGIQLLSHLCCQFHIPKAMQVAKLGIDVMFTLLSVLEKEEWVYFFLQTLPSLVLMCQAFPPLCDDASALLSQLGRVCLSQMTVDGNPSKATMSLASTKSDKEYCADKMTKLFFTIQTTFSQLCGKNKLFC